MFRVSSVFIFAQAGETVECSTFVHHTGNIEISRDAIEFQLEKIVFLASLCVSRNDSLASVSPIRKLKLSLGSHFPEEKSRKIWKTLPATLVRSVMAEDIILKCLSWVKLLRWVIGKSSFTWWMKLYGFRLKMSTATMTAINSLPSSKLPSERIYFQTFA